MNQIEARILDGELKEGDRICSERELSQQFGVSRTAVRDALFSLREKGLIEVRQGNGAYISNHTLNSTKNSLDLFMKINKAFGFENLVEIREILEPEIAALAAKRATEKNIRAMRETIRKMDESLDDAEKFIDADIDFHLALAKGSRNKLISLLINTIIDILYDQLMSIFMVEGGPSRGQHHHKRILEAIERRDPEASREAMREHLKQVRRDVDVAERGLNRKEDFI